VQAKDFTLKAKGKKKGPGVKQEVAEETEEGGFDGTPWGRILQEETERTEGERM
jgi:hypothetical protein